MRRFLPLLALLLLFCAGLVLLPGLGIGWEALARHQDMLIARVAAHPAEAAALYVAAYVVTAALSLPHAAIMTVAGGLLFGAIAGCALTVAGATIGATILLLAIRSALGKTLERHRERIPAQLQARLARDGFSYLLALRLVPLVPFWIVNLAAAFAEIRLAVFVPATLLGIVPASFILSSIGAGVGGILAQGGTPDLSVLFGPRILLPLLGLAALSLLPVLLRRRAAAEV
nr:VTT domain-containing protein [uncultured Rhodopila sp.]